MDRSERESDEQWERAVSARLARLRTMPVDTGRLADSLRRQLPRPEAQAAQASRGRLVPWLWLRPARAVAASFLVIGALVAVLMLSTSSGPVLASPAQMAKLHEDLVSGRTPVMRVESVEQANQMLAAQWRSSPQVPGVPPSGDGDSPPAHVMACCMKSVKDKKVACVLLKRQGVPVTMTVANASDMRLPQSPKVSRNGRVYHLQAAGGLNMVMTERQGRWVCLIGELPSEGLMDLADQLRF